MPSGVSIEMKDDQVNVKGPKGTLTAPRFAGISLNQEGNEVTLSLDNENSGLAPKHGLMRALIANCVTGVTAGFEKNLVLQGVGYRAQLKGKQLVLTLGYSHDVIFDQPDDIKIEVPEPTKVKVTGIDKQRVGQVAAQIRSFRKPEPYKGKGVRYENEQIRRKAGKAGKK